VGTRVEKRESAHIGGSMNDLATIDLDGIELS
jgi:hypothetical protein